MALQEAAGPAPGPPQGPATHHCRDCGVYFESSKSLEVHLQYHKENLLTKWASQAAQAHSTGDADNNNIKRRDFPAQTQPAQTAPADSTVLPSGPGRPNSATGYPPAGSPFQAHPQTPSSYTSAPSPFESDVPSNPGPSPSSTSFGYANGNTEYPQHTYNGYARSPRAGYYTEEGFPIANPPAEYPGMRATTPSSPSSSSAFRFQSFKPYNQEQKNGVSSSSPMHCDKCGVACESPGQLAEHMKNHQIIFNSNGSAFQPPEAYHDAPDILDLDCQQKFRPEEDNPLPPVNNPHSVTAMLTPWPNNKSQGFSYVSSTNTPYQNGAFQEAYPPNPPTSNVPTPNPIPTPTSPKSDRQSNSGKGDAWKSNEARRPKTYNCSACNKWFTSSGHLKRHYNTTLHKNAVKQSGHPDPASLPISSHHHPNRDPAYIHSSKTPAGSNNPPPNMSGPPKKKAKSMSPQGDGSGSSPALSTTADESSRSGFGSNFDVHSPPSVSAAQPPYDNGYPATEPYDYYRYDTHRLPLQPQPQSNNTSSSSSSTSSTSSAAVSAPPPGIPSQPPNYQAGPSVSPSGGLPPFCHPISPSHLTPNHPSITTTTTTTFMGETITTPVSDHHHHQPQHMHPDQQQLATTQPFINNLTTIGSSSEQTALPSFSQLLPSYYESDYGFIIKTETEEFNNFEYPVIKTELDDFEGMLSDNSQSPTSPIQVPTSTIEVIPKAKRVPRRRKKVEVSSNLVSSTGSPTRRSDIKCEECDKYFNRICYLTQHNKCFHSGAKPFKCDRCGKRFHSEGGAKEHERRHAGVKPYKCEICPKSFNHKTDLRRHLYLHSGSKPFACDSCGKGFIRKDHMLKHTETHKGARRRFMDEAVDNYLDGLEKKPKNQDN